MCQLFKCVKWQTRYRTCSYHQHHGRTSFHLFAVLLMIHSKLSSKFKNCLATQLPLLPGKHIFVYVHEGERFDASPLIRKFHYITCDTSLNENGTKNNRIENEKIPKTGQRSSPTYNKWNDRINRKYQ